MSPCFNGFFDKKIAGGAVKNEIIQNKELTEEPHKPIIRKFEKRKVRSSFIDKTRGADLADMQLISKFNKGICFCRCVLMTCLVNMYGLLAQRIKKVLQLLMLFKRDKSQESQTTNQKKK